MKRIVLDTNVLVSATIVKDSNPDKVLQLWRRGEVELITSPLLLEEFADVLTRPNIQKLQWMSPEEAAELVYEFSHATQVAPGELTLTGISRDPKDDMVISAAVEMNADYIVSGDDDLLTLKEYKKIGACKDNCVNG